MKRITLALVALLTAQFAHASGFVDFRTSDSPKSAPLALVSPAFDTNLQTTTPPASAPPASGPSSNWLVGASGIVGRHKSEGAVIVETRIGVMQNLFGIKGFSPTAFGMAGSGPSGAAIFGGGLGGNIPLSSNGWFLAGVIGAGHASDLGTVAIGTVGIYFTFSS
jgi:hypothetical protein